MSVIPEAQLQAYVLELTRKAFPHVSPENFKVEKRFKLKLGHTEQNYNGSALWEAEGRADLLVFHNERALAVFELKREDKALTVQDLKQGQSYAAMLFPRPPLVIISNGNDTWVRQVDSGSPLDGDIDGAEVIEAVFKNVGKLAASNNSWAIEVLMGPETNVWVETVRQRTDEHIECMTGDPLDVLKPFCRDLLFQRTATTELFGYLLAGRKAVIVEGPPLSGKSNVLRDFALTARDSPDWAVLMINGAAAGGGLFQRLANLLGAALEWNLSSDDVRTWLRRMSRSSRKPALVLAVDGFSPDTAVANDFEELAETGFGNGLRLIACADRANNVLLDKTGRGESAVAPIAAVVQIGALDDDEFQTIRDQLAAKRILFQDGAELSDEYRSAWLLRSVLAIVPPPSQADQVAVIPAAMGLQLIKNARKRLKGLHDVARLYRLIARDALGDQEIGSPELALARANGFVVRRDALGRRGEDAAVKLEAQGWATFYRHFSGDDLVALRVPEFFISEMATELADALDKSNADGSNMATAFLKRQAGSFFLGDIIGTQALIDWAVKRNGLPISTIENLMNDPPEINILAGKVIRMEMPDGRPINFHIDDLGGIARTDDQGNAITPYSPPPLDGDFGGLYGNSISWLILSQLATVRTTIGDTIEDRVDIEIMLWIGQCNIPLMRGGGIETIKPHYTNTFGTCGTVLSAQHALAEPITGAIHKLFATEWQDLDFFFTRLVEIDSLPLTVRVHNALNALQGSVVQGLEDWARLKMVEIVGPLMRKQMAVCSA